LQTEIKSDDAVHKLQFLHVECKLN